MTNSDLETASLLAQLAALETTWRNAAELARGKANGPVSDRATYESGYADALDRCVQGLRGLAERW